MTSLPQDIIETVQEYGDESRKRLRAACGRAIGIFRELIETIDAIEEGGAAARSPATSRTP